MSILQDSFPKSFFKNIIKKQFKDDIQILGTDISYVVPPGENYSCELLRIVVKFSDKTKNDVQSKSMIVKRLLENKVVIEINKELEFCTCEFGIYCDILPMMDKLGYKQKVAPKSYYTSTNLKTLIVVEDLSTLNYTMVNRQKGLNLEHCLLAIKKLAYFHASSLALYEKDSKVMDQYSKELWSKTQIFDNLISSAIQGTIAVCKKEPSLQKYVKKLKNNIKEKIYISKQRDPKFNVLTHGDFWCNNIMFQYNSDKSLKDVLFIDFQLSAFASPFLDLHYFIATSTNLEVKKNYISDIIRCYYDAFVKHVNILNIKTIVLNWKDFEKEFNDKAYMGFLAIFGALPLIKANKRNDASIENFMKNGKEGCFRDHCFTNSNYITDIKFLLAFYDNLRVFDD